MSITVRLWSQADLAKIGKDMKLTTIFMNASTFSGEEIKHYPYHLRRTFNVMTDAMEPGDDAVQVYAPNPAMAKWFTEQEYNGKVDWMTEIMTRTKEINLSTLSKSPRATRHPRSRTSVRKLQ